LLLVLLGALGLLGNYVTYLLSVRHISPGGAQVLIQLAPLLLLLGSVIVFREPFSRTQWAGAAALAAGLVLFFNGRFGHLAEAPGFLRGVLWMIVASATWAGYAMAQKRLLATYPSPAILLMLYALSTVILAPAAAPRALGQLDGTGWALLGFACVNTVLAYGAFAEALVHWEASRVSATLAVTPLITILASLAINAARPGAVALEPLNALAGLGALLVVTGSAVTALGRAR
jgi:drug/metabolite transporter (DMT)-like permease